ncbi:3-hydroxyisobutyryl-CoA hydrolase, mitochondrial-like [Ischnura elegans]|uniref:3-hydroxyisobutyryl-CoA hydrolase, mitochondrial-like n=1 Tax=Ischnura elegans TaxID=197161 RepID=UPI001ED89A13|nr:3-hydroxyisobutyryl-CoA hydrolase, mitochondrial-like [Ischnura elegans]
MPELLVGFLVLERIMMGFFKALRCPGIRMVGRPLSSVSASPSAAPAPAPSMAIPSEAKTVDGVTVMTTSEGKAIIQVDRPQALNSLSTRAIPLLSSALASWYSGPNMVLVTSRGKVFCAGGDLKGIASLNEHGRLSFFREGYRGFNLMASMPVPTVCLVRGHALGAGMALAAHCRFAVASDRSAFSLPEAAVGFYTDNGASGYASKLPGRVGFFLALTGTNITAEDAKNVGVISHVIAPERFNMLERELLAMDDPTDEKIRSLLDEHEFASAGKRERLLNEDVLARVRDIFSEGSVEAVVKKLSDDGSPLAKKCLAAMRTFSPTSLKVIHRSMELGLTRPLAHCLRREILISFRMSCEPDFKEGVRAILVDKDKRPSWNPRTLEEVSSEYVERIVSLPDVDEHDLAHLFTLPATSSS